MTDHRHPIDDDLFEVLAQQSRAAVCQEELKTNLDEAIEICAGDKDELLTRAADALEDTGSLHHLLIDDAEPRTGHYSRHLAVDDPFGRYTTIFIVWRPDACSPVQAHQTWCVYRVLRGQLTERTYCADRVNGGALGVGRRRREKGAIGMSTSTSGGIHQLMNEGATHAVSLHVYGIDSSRMTTHVNRVFDRSTWIADALT